MRPSGSVYLKLETRLGEEIDYENAQQGHIVRLIPGLRLDLARHLRLELNETWERLNVDGSELYHANVSEVRATYQLTTRMFVRAISQYFEVARDPSLYTFPIGKKDQALFNQFLFSYKVNPQVVLFLGYSDNYFNNLVRNLTQANRTLFFKVGYAFVL